MEHVETTSTVETVEAVETVETVTGSNPFITYAEITGLTDKFSVINVDQVSNVGFIPAKNRIIFNFNHSTETDAKNAPGKKILIADYQYWTIPTELYDTVTTKLVDRLLEFGFISSTDENHHLVNPMSISYINTDESQYRLIFNLSTTITKFMMETVDGTREPKRRVLNDFVFWTFQSKEEFDHNIKYINDELLSSSL